MNDTNIINDTYSSYLSDESGYYGHADNISFPKDQTSLLQIAQNLFDEQIPVTMQGARTGIVGAGVPTKGAIINISKLNSILGLHCENGTFYLRVSPGVLFSDLEQCLQACKFDTKEWDDDSQAAYQQLLEDKNKFFIPGPTEKTATVGGAFAMGAAGINAVHYGAFQKQVERISVKIPSGDFWNIQRGEFLFSEEGCKLPNGKFLPFLLSENEISPTTPFLYGRPGMDLIDLFAGSEGMYGIITELTLRLTPSPENMWGVACFFDSLSCALDFIEFLISHQYEDVVLSAIEFADSKALEYVCELKKTSSKLSDIPDISDEIQCMIYFELLSETENSEATENVLFEILSVLEDMGVPEQRTWAACGNDEIERLRKLRHAIPESINQRISFNHLNNPYATKISMDFSAPTQHFRELFKVYYDDISESDIPAVIFGHILDCRLHINFLPETEIQTFGSKNLLLKWADKIKAYGGLVCSENGLGKTKRYIFSNAITSLERQLILQTKEFFDPMLLLNPGNCFMEKY